MRAELGDPAGAEHGDPVGRPHRRQAVGDHDRGAARQGGLDRRLHVGLVVVVEVGREGRGSIVIRWLLPPVALIPIVIGAIRIWGESAGLMAFASIFGAAQSVLMIGQVGQPRSTPDYFPLIVMNSMLGGQFTSRVNMNLREAKGYTYGARTGFSLRKGAGPFSASADVQTAVTKESVVEFMKELNGIRGEIPVTQAELEYNKQSMIRRFPGGFETTNQIAGQLANVVIYGLPDSYFNEYIAKINAVKLEDVNRVAETILPAGSKMAIVIVGEKRRST